MNDFYDPKTNMGPAWDQKKHCWLTDGCTHKNDAPEHSHGWYIGTPAKVGFCWKPSNKGPWPEEVPIPPPSAEELEKQKQEQWKAERQALVDAIVVDIDGLAFDGDEISQNRMARAMGLADSPDETTVWKLADKSFAQVTADQLRRGARAAGDEMTRIWAMENEELQAATFALNNEAAPKEKNIE